jgi:DNA-binding SARP family transcriptional activator
MQINILGPLQVSLDGRMVEPTARKTRQVFSLLAVRAGQLVTVPALMEELWGMDPPRSAIQSVQTYILRLRQLIERALPDGAGPAKAVLVTRPGGYTLDISPEDVDVHRFQELTAEGERAVEAGDHMSGSRLLGAALGVWRGPALVDVRVGTLLAVDVVRLEQSRLAVLVSRIEADLRLGRHRQLLGELAELNARYPMHEKLCAQYMTVLHASGCKWRALEIFRTLRERLVNELGVEPSVQVQTLQRAILNSDVEPREPGARKRTAVGAVG